MNELQKQKAIEALDKHKTQEKKKRYAMLYHLGAYAKLHYMGVLLPYKILRDLEKAEHDKTFNEVPPNPYYPAPAMTLKTSYTIPPMPTVAKETPIGANGYPDFRADEERRKQWEEYQQRIEAEKMPSDKWGYYYARFLLPYDLTTFSDFDFWGEIPKDEETKRLIDEFRATCIEAQEDCREHPENFNLEPIPRLEKHRNIYDVPYGYI